MTDTFNAESAYAATLKAIEDNKVAQAEKIIQFLDQYEDQIIASITNQIKDAVSAGRFECAYCINHKNFITDLNIADAKINTAIARTVSLHFEDLGFDMSFSKLDTLVIKWGN